RACRRGIDRGHPRDRLQAGGDQHRPRIRAPRLVRPRMTHTITLIPDAGIVAFEKTGQALPVALIESIRRNTVALKGPVTTPIAQGFTSVNVGLRKALDLYANLRPVWNLPGVDARFQGVDLVIVRENTEDLYSGLEHEVVPG